MRLARITFHRQVLMRDEGLSKDLFLQMLQALPSDAKIVGFGEDPSYGTCNLLVTSKEFKDVMEGYRPNDIVPSFESTWSESGYTAKFSKLDMSDALERADCCKSWQMKRYVGIMESYNYCSVCGKKEIR